MYVATSTNAHFLTEQNVKALIDSGLDRIIISLDGLDQQVYSSYRKGGDIEKVKEGLKRLIDQKHLLKSSKPYIILQTLVLKTNEYQIDEIKKFGREIGADRVEFKSVQIYNYKQGHPLIPATGRYIRYKKQSDGSYILRKKLISRCFKMWSSCVVTWDLNVLSCCFDKNAEYDLGNIESVSLKNVWENDMYDQFREKVLKERRKIEMCCNCSE
jgi:radical SAM protein with 4Fe4S-binding SPASM domain